MEPSSQRALAPSVLIVDDNPAIRNVVSWSLRLGGFQPIEAANGLEAIQWIEQASCEERPPSVILLDLAMPEMNGQAFLTWLHSSWNTNYPLPAVILITAAHLKEPVDTSGAVKQIMTKPFHVHDLLEVIRKWAG